MVCSNEAREASMLTTREGSLILTEREGSLILYVPPLTEVNDQIQVPLLNANPTFDKNKENNVFKDGIQS